MDENIEVFNNDARQLIRYARNLDTRWTQSIAEIERKKKEIVDALERCHQGLEECRESSRMIQDGHREASKRIHRLEAIIQNMVSKDDLKGAIREHLSPLESMLRSFDAEMHVVMERCRVASDNSSDHESRLNALEDDNGRCVERFESTEDVIRDLEVDMNDLKNHLEDMHASQVDEFKAHRQSLHERKLDISKSLSQIEKFEMNLSAKMLKELSRASNEMSTQMDAFKSEILKLLESKEQESLGIKKVVQKVKDDMLKALQGGKSPKKIQDFMDQVKYNAEQIAKINDRLDARK